MPENPAARRTVFDRCRLGGQQLRRGAVREPPVRPDAPVAAGDVGDAVRPHAAAGREVPRARTRLRRGRQPHPDGRDASRTAEFVGVDLSARQIADGERIVRAAGLTNVSLRHASILDVDETYGHVRLHHLPRRLLVGAGRASATRSSTSARSTSRPNGVAYVVVQHVPRLAHARHDPRHDALPRDAVRHARSTRDQAGPRAARLPRAVGTQRRRRVLHASQAPNSKRSATRPTTTSTTSTSKT